jgi:hypothetical protein
MMVGGKKEATWHAFIKIVKSAFWCGDSQHPASVSEMDSLDDDVPDIPRFSCNF